MDKVSLLSRLRKKFPAAILEARDFCGGAGLSVWVEPRMFLDVSRWLAKESAPIFDWVENVTVADIDGSLVLSYFLRSQRKPEFLVLRVSEPLPGPTERVVFESARKLWPSASPGEDEGAELFGLQFKGYDLVSQFLPPGFVGFPLRKAFEA